MNNEFKKLIHTAQKIKLSEEKKAFVRARIQEFVEMTPVRKPIKQPLRSPFYVSKFSVLHMSKAISFALIVLIAGGGTMSYASEDALPGDVFYTVKVNIKEPIEEKLAFTPEAKLQVKTKQVEKRLTEAQVLLQKNDTTPEKHKEVEERVEKKVQEIEQAIDELQEKGDVETILATTGKLEPVLKAHQEALKEVREDNEVPVEISLAKMNDFEGSTEEEATLSESATLEESNVPAEQTSAEVSEVIETTKSTIADSLLKTVERTLVTVEEKETKALETVAEIEKTENAQEIISNVTDKKVEDVVKEINQIKNDLPSEQVTTTLEGETVEDVIDTGIQTLDSEIKQDGILISITEAELLLAESQKLFEQGLYKESLAKAQEATKLIAMIQANQKIDAAKETTTETVKEPALQEPAEEKINTINIEDQAGQVIEAVESSIETKTISQ